LFAELFSHGCHLLPFIGKGKRSSSYVRHIVFYRAVERQMRIGLFFMQVSIFHNSCNIKKCQLLSNPPLKSSKVVPYSPQKQERVHRARAMSPFFAFLIYITQVSKASANLLPIPLNSPRLRKLAHFLTPYSHSPSCNGFAATHVTQICFDGFLKIDLPLSGLNSYT